jgi:DNA primase
VPCSPSVCVKRIIIDMDEVAEVKARLEITEVVGAYLPLKQAGRNLKAPCPFHQEKTASFMVSPDKGIYHCFGCGEGGDIFSFVMKMEGVDFKQALEMLARKAGVEIANRSENKEVSKLRARLLEAHQLAVQYFQMSLVKNERALDYVKRRGMARETIKDFQIGYAPDSWSGLTDILRRRGFAQKELLQAGLAGQREGRSTIYDWFRGRIMFTICDREGRPIGFTARVLDDSLPKYINTPQTLLYDKSQAIYGLNLAKEAIRRADEVVLVEGNMDVIASHRIGVRQVVAASGTALTLEQLRTLSKLTKNIKLAFDSDRAGLAATERAIELGQTLGLTIRMVGTGDAKDPDELISKDPKAWELAIAQSTYIVDYLLDRYQHDFDLGSGVGKRAYVDKVAGVLRRLGDPVERDHYIQLVAEQTGTRPEAVEAKLEGEEMVAESKPAETAKDAGPVRRAVVQVDGRPSARRLLEESLLALCLGWQDCMASLSDMEETDFTDEARRQIYQYLASHKEATGAEAAKSLTDVGDYINILLLRGEQEFADLAPADRSFEAFELARRLQMASNKDSKKVLNQRLRDAEEQGDVQLVSNLLAQYQALLEEEK